MWTASPPKRGARWPSELTLTTLPAPGPARGGACWSSSKARGGGRRSSARRGLGRLVEPALGHGCPGDEGHPFVFAGFGHLLFAGGQSGCSGSGRWAISMISHALLSCAAVSGLDGSSATSPATVLVNSWGSWPCIEWAMPGNDMISNGWPAWVTSSAGPVDLLVGDGAHDGPGTGVDRPVMMSEQYGRSRAGEHVSVVAVDGGGAGVEGPPPFRVVFPHVLGWLVEAGRDCVRGLDAHRDERGHHPWRGFYRQRGLHAFPSRRSSTDRRAICSTGRTSGRGPGGSTARRRG